MVPPGIDAGFGAELIDRLVSDTTEYTIDEKAARPERPTDRGNRP